LCKLGFGKGFGHDAEALPKFSHKTLIMCHWIV
jgi:hypothetical protein